jgi:hypothetical protein
MYINITHTPKKHTYIFLCFDNYFPQMHTIIPMQMKLKLTPLQCYSPKKLCNAAIYPKWHIRNMFNYRHDIVCRLFIIKTDPAVLGDDKRTRFYIFERIYFSQIHTITMHIKF